MYTDVFPKAVTYNLTLSSHQVYRLPDFFSRVRVAAGCAWVTFAGDDIILREHQSLAFDLAKGPAVITALGQTPLVLEVAGN
jgi:hypothetical protein